MKFSSPLAKSVLAIALVTTACRDGAKNSAQTDSGLARDLELASVATPQPTFQDTALGAAPQAPEPKTVEPPPVRPRTGPKQLPKVDAPPQRVAQQPTPAPVVVQQTTAPTIVPAPPPAAPRREIGSGSAALMTSTSKVCTSTNMPGDKLVATLNSSLTGSNGAELPAGSTVVLEVASVESGDKAENARITFRVRSVVINDKTYSVAADVLPTTTLDRTRVQNADPNAEKKKVAGGAIAGAIIGQMIGHGAKGTLIGAAAGAAAGAAVSKAGEKWEACLPVGAQIQLKLNEALVLS